MALGTARALGAAFAEVVVVPEAGAGERALAVLAVGGTGDPRLVDAVADGLASRGVDVDVVGRTSTDGFAHASGALEVPGLLVTTAAAPAGGRQDAVRLLRAGARDVGADVARVREAAARYVAESMPPGGGTGGPATGRVVERALSTEYASFLRSLVSLAGLRRLRLVVDAGTGAGSVTVPAVLGQAAALPAVPVHVVLLREPARGVDRPGVLAGAVTDHGADLGIALDDDAERLLVLDERGVPVEPSVVATVVGLREVGREMASGRTPTVVLSGGFSHGVTDLLASAGAQVVRTRRGPGAMAAEMARHGAVLGAEHPDRFVFRDLFGARSGLAAALHMIAAVGSQPHPLSALVQVYQPYATSGPIVVPVVDPAAARARVVQAYGTERGGGRVEVDDADGVAVSHWASTPQWSFAVQESTGADGVGQVIVSVEAVDEDVMEKVRDDVLALVAAAGGAPAGDVGGPGDDPGAG